MVERQVGPVYPKRKEGARRGHLLTREHDRAAIECLQSRRPRVCYPCEAGEIGKGDTRPPLLGGPPFGAGNGQARRGEGKGQELMTTKGSPIF